MKLLKLTISIIAVSLGVAFTGAAAAQDPVIYRGGVQFTDPVNPPLDCTLHITGEVNTPAQTVTIDGAAVTGTALCETIDLAGFNWVAMLSSAPPNGGTTSISGVGIYAFSGMAICGPGPFSISNISYSSWSLGFTGSSQTPDSFSIPYQSIGYCTIESTTALERIFP